MSVLNNSSEEVVECPLCMEPLEVDDLNFYPCTCGYQICRFCWHRIRTDENELCPACRKAYPENPADFTPLTQEQIAALKAEKRQRDQQRKQKITENRKHLANVRVVQKNLVFVVGLPPRLADADILKKYEYFGKYGKIHKVVINPSTTYAGVQGPSASAYVTYVHNNDALRAIQSVNNITIDGRLIKTSLGTTKYCSHFMKNQQCPKSDCMYLHELGDSEASFTKEEMHQGKHQEYEKRLHEALLQSNALGVGTNNTTTSGTLPPLPNSTIQSTNNGVIHNVTNSNSNSSNSSVSGNGSNSIPAHSKEAWPSLSVSPVNASNEKEKDYQHQQKINSKNSKNGNNKENNIKKHEKVKLNDKKSQKNQKSNNVNITSNNNNNNNNLHNNNMHHCKDRETGGLKENNATNIQILPEQQYQQNNQHTNGKDHHNHKTEIHKSTKDSASEKHRLNSLDDEITLIEQLEKADSVNSDTTNPDNCNNGSAGGRSSSSSSSTSSTSSSVSMTSVSSSISDSTASSLSETASGKSSPGNFTDAHNSNNSNTIQQQQQQKISSNQQKQNSDLCRDKNISQQKLLTSTENSINHLNGTIMSDPTNSSKQKIPANDTNNLIDTTSCLSKLSLFDDNSSFFSSASSFPTFNNIPLMKGKLDSDNRTLMNNHLNSTISSHLPDLLNGIDNYNQNHSINPLNGINGGSEDWEAAFKYVLMRNSKNLEEQQHHQQQQASHHQEEILRMHEMNKRNILNNIGTNPINGLHDFGNTDFGNADFSRLSQQALLHQQQRQTAINHLQQHNDILSNNLFGSTNMSKFFDFHKNQQAQQQHQQHQQHQYMMNGLNNGFMNDHRDHLNMGNILDANRLTSQLLEHGIGGGQQLQKPRFNNSNNLNNKYEQITGHNNHSMLMNNPNNSNQQQPQNRIPNQFCQNSSVDDELGFDPFIETQKALAELIENENQSTNLSVTNKSANNGHNNSTTKHPQQQQQQNLLENCQRARMPPPGFNHMNAFGFGVPRAQSSKILPFMNNSGSNGGNNMQQQPQQQQQLQQQNNWAQHFGFQQQNSGHSMNEQQQLHHLQQNTDWTAMDPAILSFRQFPFSSHQQQPQHNADMFMQHLTQQNLQQAGQGFGHPGGNTLLNPQQNSQNQMNFASHAGGNWLNNDQSLFMNSLANGFNNSTNNYDKFSIPMPPGMHSSNMMSGKQQKTELIN